MRDEITIGARLRVLRRWRGMSLQQLADQASLSKGFLSMAERGQRALDRRSHIAALATALQVSETDLVGGPHLGSDPDQSEPHTYVPALRTVLETNGIGKEPVIEQARPVNELATLMSGPIERQRRRYNFVRVGQALPDLIDELHVHAYAPVDDAVRRLALDTLIEAYMCAAGMARSLGYPDLGQLAAMHADEAATALDDPIAKGRAAFSLLRPNAGNWHRIQTMAERAVNALEPYVHGTDGLDVLGMLTLNAALAAAARLDSDAVNHWLGEAAMLASRIPDDLDRNWQAFSATNVAIWRISVGVEAGAMGGEIAEQAATVDENKLSVHPARRACYLADVGRGLARDPRSRGEAVQWLRRAEQVAPQRIRNDHKAREAVSVMLEQARASAGGIELRGIAARMGIPH